MRLARIVPGVAVTLVLSLPVMAGAQEPRQRFQSEGRLDVIAAHTTAVQAGYGLSVLAGTYVRTGLVVGAGAGRNGFDARTDLITRFSFDPFRQSRWAPYAGGGVSGRFRPTADGGTNAYLLVFLGLEGPLPRGQSSGIVPAFELGLGGGARFGVILRRGITARR